MLFSVPLTIPPNTPAATPIVLDVPFPPGTIHKVDVQFPAGCVGLAHTLARRGAHQVWPTNDSNNLAGNAETITWQDEYDLAEAPFTLRLVGWNLDDFYAHTVTWRFALRSFPPGPQLEAVQVLYQLVIDSAAGAG